MKNLEIINIHTHTNRPGILYAELWGDGELQIAATLDYIVKALKRNTLLYIGDRLDHKATIVQNEDGTCNIGRRIFNTLAGAEVFCLKNLQSYNIKRP